eukprot:CAMPEP_0177451512 /NCGR_PEP_ID=MMETSP0369-20130122/9814_1 /TAXON_ID=447022 ORGANISM="Scrippsiella hangoei-like, Strain SHHI-4" /NCGR_SAMPLE_ID=MMETSP0369 /ASSEMBLY_ACC=CAM_ASM_000364 /LENGTH=113 /DNA_ID=CAMNT_0018924123 /DNA_START=658 /DNA_END=999 /DNA_ORIENTATION=+
MTSCAWRPSSAGTAQRTSLADTLVEGLADGALVEVVGDEGFGGDTHFRAAATVLIAIRFIVAAAVAAATRTREDEHAGHASNHVHKHVDTKHGIGEEGMLHQMNRQHVQNSTR